MSNIQSTPQNRQETIENIADTLRTALDIQGLPIDVNTLASKLGGEIVEVDDSIEAKVVKKNKSFKITLNRSTHPLRKRFSIAHELGHIILHWGLLNDDIWQEIKDDTVLHREGVGRLEYEANEFAAALLMPKSLFKEKVFENSANGYCNVNVLADKFNVSLEAVKVRGRWLGCFSW